MVHADSHRVQHLGVDRLLLRKAKVRATKALGEDDRGRERDVRKPSRKMMPGCIWVSKKAGASQVISRLAGRVGGQGGFEISRVGSEALHIPRIESGYPGAIRSATSDLTREKNGKTGTARTLI